jgi:acetyltransferase-like isoleucine patch superfamily enzyme
MSEPAPSAAELPANPYHANAWIVGEPKIGPGTWIGAFTVIDGSGGLSIGAGCDISSGAQIYSHSTVMRCVSGREYAEVDRKPTRIGDRVFVGAHAVVNMGVTVGDEAVIAAGAVVTADVSSRAVVGGVPARLIGHVVGAGPDTRIAPLRSPAG